MLAVVAVLIGAVVGWGLKTLSDLLAEKRYRRREDVIWRRQHYVDAVAALTHAGRELTAADSRMSRAIHSLSNAEQGGNPAIIAACREANIAAAEEQRPWTTATMQALEVVRLYAPDNVTAKADALWGTIMNQGSFPRADAITAFEAAVLGALEELRTEARTTAGLA